MGKTLLLADDSSTIRKIVELAFGGTLIRVVTTASGAEAMDALRRERPDLLLADVVMPEPDGYELCRWVKRSDRPIPVVLLAGTFEPFDEGLARASGADGHLVKPFESELLRSKVEGLLASPPPPQLIWEDDEPGITLKDPASSAPRPEGLAVTDAQSSRASTPRIVAAAAPTAPSEDRRLSAAEIDAIAQVVLERITSATVREWVRRELPRIAEQVVRERIAELEQLDPDAS